VAQQSERQELIETLVSAIESNPDRTVVQIVLRAAAHSSVFTPDDTDDAGLLHGLRNLAQTPRTNL
jgi:hypothetical protein